MLAIHKLGLKMKTPLEMSSDSGDSGREKSFSSSRAGNGGDGREDRRNSSSAPTAVHEACFGYLRWIKDGDEASARSYGEAKYACFSDDEDVSKVFKLLSECWKLKQPSVLISVTGSAQELELEPKLQTDFEKGLAEAAECTNGWLISGGTDAGVMALVGRALRKRQLAAAIVSQQVGSAKLVSRRSLASTFQCHAATLSQRSIGFIVCPLPAERHCLDRTRLKTLVAAYRSPHFPSPFVLLLPFPSRAVVMQTQ